MRSHGTTRRSGRALGATGSVRSGGRGAAFRSTGGRTGAAWSSAVRMRSRSASWVIWAG